MGVKKRAVGPQKNPCKDSVNRVPTPGFAKMQKWKKSGRTPVFPAKRRGFRPVFLNFLRAHPLFTPQVVAYQLNADGMKIRTRAGKGRPRGPAPVPRLCFALDGEAQRRSGFRYQYSCYQVEYSRNLLFKSGRLLDEVYQGLIERTWRQLDVPRLKTIFGRKSVPIKIELEAEGWRGSWNGLTTT
jgi:hypothetical protein